MKRRLLPFLILGICLILNSQASAQIKLDKNEVRLTVKPGEENRGAIIVTNLSDKESFIKAYFEDLIYPPPFNGIKDTRPLGSTPWSCGEWINLSSQEFNIPPYGEREVTYCIKVPQEAKGGYYGVLFFEKSSAGLEAGIGVGINVRLGYLFFLETENKERKGEIEDVSVTEGNIQGYFLNSGNVLLVSDGTFYIMDEKGMVLDRGRLGRFYVPSGEKAPFVITLSQTLPSSKYTLFVNYDLGEGQIAVKEVDFLKDKAGIIKVLKVRD